jgi:thiol-disulfide isomerase/thioredoxin
MAARIAAGIAVIGGVVAIGVVLAPQKSTPPTPRRPAPVAAELDNDIETAPESTQQTRKHFEPGMLLVGDPAPVITASRWFQGEPTVQLEPGRVHVVDLWATWCAPCVRAMPHLNQLQADYSDQGLRVIAISIDKGAGAENQVERFIERRAEDIGFDVALDEGATNESWLNASGRTTIPTSFVVDKEGTVVWIGNPMAPEGEHGDPVIDRVLREVFGGSYDSASAIADARSEISAARKARELQDRVSDLTTQMGSLWSEGKIDEALAVIDQIIEIDPAGNSGLAIRKAEVLLAERNKPADASAFFESLINGPYFDDNDTLIRLANLFSGSLDPGELGRDAAVTAASLVVSRPGADPDTILVLAKAQFAAGQQADAVKTAIWARDFYDHGSPEYDYYDQFVVQYERTD